MSHAAAVIRRIINRGRPAPLGRWLRLAVRNLDLALLLMPVAALLIRLQSVERPPVLLSFCLLVLGVFVLAALTAALQAFARRPNPLASARALDDLNHSSELFLTAVELGPQPSRSAFMPLLIARAETLLSRNPKASRQHAWRLPALRRDLICLALALLILLVPPLPRGWLGARSGSGTEAGLKGLGPGDQSNDQASQENDQLPPRAGISGRLQVRASTDRALYFLGEEIQLRIELEATEAVSPADFEVILIVDGEIEMALPLPEGFQLPRAAGERQEAVWPMKARLELIERYRRGILAIDARVELRDPDNPEAQALGNRVLVQIAENSEKVQQRRPTPVEKAPQKEQPKDQEPKPPEKDRDEEKRPNENQEPKAKPKPHPGDEPSEQPPEDLASKDFVVEPLFSGDQTEKRKVKVFDRDRENADPEPPQPGAKTPPTRRYEATIEAEMKKLGLVGAERRLVRRYLEGLQPPPEKQK